MVEDENGINKIPCPKCGSLMRKDGDFCLSCGKDLRTN
jgi:ribosomal protein S27AE